MSTTLEQSPIQQPEPRPPRNRRALIIILAVLAVIAIATAVTIAVFTGNEEPAPSPGNPPSAAPTATAPSAVQPSPGSATPSQPAAPNEPADPVLGDGRYPAYLTAIDTGARTVTFDVIQYLTGEEAERAFHRDHPDIKEGPPNGFYIVNQNPRLRTLPVRKDVPVQVLWLGGGLGSDTITFEQLPDYFVNDPIEDKYLWYDPFWLTVRGGRITDIAEQYIP